MNKCFAKGMFYRHSKQKQKQNKIKRQKTK